MSYAPYGFSMNGWTPPRTSWWVRVVVGILLFLLGVAVCRADYYRAFPIPKRFDHEPAQRVIVQRLDPLGMFFLCPGAYACTAIGSSPCRMLMPKGRVAFFWRHERAHCNGWPSDHPYP